MEKQPTFSSLDVTLYSLCPSLLILTMQYYQFTEMGYRKIKDDDNISCFPAKNGMLHDDPASASYVLYCVKDRGRVIV